jgi:23S rRNA U2552 (ribose-2'-O)-methylase RlmE/FtsJ
MTTLKWLCMKDMGERYLDNLREECLLAMSQIDSMTKSSWHFFRKLLNEFDFESRHVAVNRAFYKLWEILAEDETFGKDPFLADNPLLRTLHLAEAPGSFVQVISEMFPLAHMVAISKPPATYADVVTHGKSVPMFSPRVTGMIKNCTFRYIDLVNDPFLTGLQGVKEFHGVKEFLGDKEFLGSPGVKELKVSKGVKKLTQEKEEEEEEEEGKFHLITADGGFDEQERYDAKETLHYNLIFSEIVCILEKQRKGGSCVLKIFEIFTETTMSMLWLLCSHYETCYFVKPSTSRPTNAEKYLVCNNFKKRLYRKEELFSLTKVPINEKMVLETKEKMGRNFKDMVLEKSENLLHQQIATINAVMAFVNKKGQNGYVNKKEFLQSKKRSFEEWKEKYHFSTTGD